MLCIDSEDSIKNLIPFLSSFCIRNDESSQSNELFSIIAYLYANYKLKQLTFPLAIIKREHPDFCLLCYEQSQSRGIEHTFSTLQDYKMAQSESRKRPEGGMLELDSYSPFWKLTKDEIDRSLRQPDEELKGKGYTGNRAEKEWSVLIKNAIHKKTKLLNKKHFEKYSSNELIIEDDSNVRRGIKLNKALDFLTNHIENYFSSPYALKFDKIHIISRNNFVCDILSKTEIVTLPKFNSWLL